MDVDSSEQHPLLVPTSRVVTTRDGLQLRVIERAANRAPTFLFIHGLASNAHLWDDVATILASDGFGSIAVDQRGHGLSEKPDGGYDFATLSDDLADVIVASGDTPVIAVGQSWGGNLVVELAGRHPELVAGVVVVDGGFLRMSEEFESWVDAERALTPPSFDDVTFGQLRSMISMGGFPESGVAAQLANFEELADGSPKARLPRAAHMTIVRHMWEHDPDEAGAAVSVPIAVIAVDREKTRKERRVQTFATASGAAVHWLDGHHDVHAQQPEVVAGLLLGFASEVVT